MENADQRGAPQSSNWPLVALLLLAAATLLTIQVRRPRPVDPLVGQTLPPLDAAGWLHVDRPVKAADLRGKIVVIDFWATSCAQCALSLPELVAFHQRFRERGVTLVGLTPEPPQYLEQIERFNRRVEGVDWPIGYGAWLAYQVTGIDAFPTYVLYDRTGTSVWAGASIDGLEEAVVALLAKDHRDKAAAPGSAGGIVGDEDTRDASVESLPEVTKTPGKAGG